MRSFSAALACACLAGAPRLAPAQDDYNPPVHATEDAIALAFITGRYSSPVTCKKTDGSVLELENSIVLKPAPESGGGNSLKVTFFGVDVPDVAYCYSLVERRIVDRRGSILVHFRSHNRADLGVSDFRRTAASGSLTYYAHRGELSARGLGSEADPADTRVLPFDGGDSKLVVDSIPAGSDGAKLLSDYDARTGVVPSPDRKRFAFRFTAKDGSQFTFWGVEAPRARR
jgi:hypothetical protein